MGYVDKLWAAEAELTLPFDCKYYLERSNMACHKQFLFEAIRHVFPTAEQDDADNLNAVITEFQNNRIFNIIGERIEKIWNHARNPRAKGYCAEYAYTRYGIYLKDWYAVESDG